ncbi:MAG TPA: FAD-dependent oxidoreductase [Crocinitomicaceae bacterium]|nr:FAD-dependent oxidoreductase [Crocinitomicaceae bacterium]
MIKVVDFIITPEQAKDTDFLQKLIQRELKINDNSFDFRWLKRSIDARKKQIKINARFEVAIGEEFPKREIFFQGQDVSKSPEIHIIGAGPAGLFAALRAIQLGLKPIVFERGKDVRERRRDLAKISKEQVVNPESNYCFGEGGAGTYSDGKLYTRSKKRGDVQKSLEWFVHFGADDDILVDAHPHIGTNKLPHIIVAMREEIIKLGGEVHFNSKMTNLVIENQSVKSIEINNEKVISVENLVLATGHSARDIYYLLHEKGVKLKAKGFALGVRIEHTQELIDTLQYHGRLNDEFLPPASYALVTQVDGKGVYSFCMCPGGIIAPCATENGEVVTNGWSPSKRNNPYSNSGIVVQIDAEDFKDYEINPFVCLDFQKEVEKACWLAAGKTQHVPAQRMLDFVNGVVSEDFPRSSYVSGIVSCDLNKILPPQISKRLKQAFLDFEKKMPGYLTNDAVLHAPESRTSSPVQIPRNPETLEHIEIKGFYPCAEGAGYAGGIISAAIDGMACVERISLKFQPKF